MDNLAEEVKARISIFDVAGRLGLTLKGKSGIYHSPFREDRKPSFSISKDGKFFNDFATNDKGDIFTFYTLATNSNFSDALNACADWCGLRRGESVPPKPRATHGIAILPHAKERREKPSIPPLVWSEREARSLEALRGYSVEAQKIAFERGVFGFCEYKGFPSWIITDGKGRCAQARRVDGELWQGQKCGHKAETSKNSDCSIPAGLEAIKDFQAVALCEGSTDFLAVFHFAYVYDCEDGIAPLAMFGAQHSIAQEALNALKGKRVIIFPDADEAGQKALEKWGEQISEYANEVFYFKFDAFRRADGKPVKDLSDFIRLDPDEWETQRPFTDPFYEILKERN